MHAVTLPAKPLCCLLDITKKYDPYLTGNVIIYVAVWLFRKRKVSVFSVYANHQQNGIEAEEGRVGLCMLNGKEIFGRGFVEGLSERPR